MMSLSLEKYQQKRKFEKTPEPEGVVGGNKGLKDNHIFVIHDHYARQHHHDLRLEMPRRLSGSGFRPGSVGSVLKSWAVPKLTPEKAGIKRLAVQVEDHPLEYANFTGTIPEGQYGAGEVKIFDHGTYKLIHQSKNSLEFELNGKKLKGIWALVQFKGESKNWLFFKTTKKLSKNDKP